jgi:hypothetical protein
MTKTQKKQYNNEAFTYTFYMSYFPYDGQNGTLSSMTNEQDNEFENHIFIVKYHWLIFMLSTALLTNDITLNKYKK